MDFLLSHMQIVVAFALIVSEALASGAQLLFPENKGFSGIIAGIIKVLQSLKTDQKAP